MIISRGFTQVFLDEKANNLVGLYYWTQSVSGNFVVRVGFSLNYPSWAKEGRWGLQIVANRLWGHGQLMLKVKSLHAVFANIQQVAIQTFF